MCVFSCACKKVCERLSERVLRVWVVRLRVREMFYHMLYRQNYCLAWTCMPNVLKYNIHTALKAAACSWQHHLHHTWSGHSQTRTSLALCFEGARVMTAHLTAPLCWYLSGEFKLPSFLQGNKITSLMKFHFMVRGTQEALKRSQHCSLTRYLGDTRPVSFSLQGLIRCQHRVKHVLVPQATVSRLISFPSTSNSPLCVSLESSSGPTDRVTWGPYIQSLIWYIHHFHRMERGLHQW